MSLSALLLSSVFCFSAAAAESVPVAQQIEPRNGPPGTVIKISGRFLDSARVTAVYLTDHRFDLLVKVLDQSAESITLRVPPFAKPGRFQVLFLADIDEKSVLLEQPVYVLVEEGPPPPAPAPEAPAAPTQAPATPAPSPVILTSNTPPAAAATTEVAQAKPGELAPTPVQIVKQAPPVYPAIAKQMKIAGAVTLTVTVEPDGKLSKVEVVDGNPILASGAVSAVKKWDFKAATVRGAPVRSTTAVVVRFGQP